MDQLVVLADAAENLYPARMQMALSLGWHIIFACFGIAFPLITVATEWRGHRRGDADLTDLAHTWAKAMGVLFAAGAVSGTLLSFEMGILWPVLMDRFGEIYGFPFVLEGFAFFIEAIFVGVYLFGWDRLSPRAHMLSALPMAVSGITGRRGLRRHGPSPRSSSAGGSRSTRIAPAGSDHRGGRPVPGHPGGHARGTRRRVGDPAAGARVPLRAVPAVARGPSVAHPGDARGRMTG
jgi:hypothetical protein